MEICFLRTSSMTWIVFVEQKVLLPTAAETDAAERLKKIMLISI